MLPRHGASITVLQQAAPSMMLNDSPCREIISIERNQRLWSRLRALWRTNLRVIMLQYRDIFVFFQVPVRRPQHVVRHPAQQPEGHLLAV